MKHFCKQLSFFCLLVIMISIPVMSHASPNIPTTRTVKIRIGDEQYVVNATINRTALSMTSNSTGVFVEDISVDLGLDEDGKLIPASVTRASDTIHREKEFVSLAFRWNGSITYNYITVGAFECYNPTQYRHKITVLDDQFELVSLSLHGGADGVCYDSSGNEIGYRFTGDRAYNISTANSGQTYSKSYGTSYYFRDAEGTNISSHGTFTYRRASTGGTSSTSTSPEFYIELV